MRGTDVDIQTIKDAIEVIDRAPGPSDIGGYVEGSLEYQEPVETLRRSDVPREKPARLTDPKLRQVKQPMAIAFSSELPWWAKPDADFAKEAERMRMGPRVNVPSANKILCFPV